MDKKKWFKSKTVWATFITVLLGAYAQIDVGAFGDALPNVPHFVFGILGALGLYSRTTATTSLTT